MQHGNRPSWVVRWLFVGFPLVSIIMGIAFLLSASTDLHLFAHPLGWIILLAFGSAVYSILLGLVLCAVASKLQKRLKSAGRCTACGYDLRGAPSEKCPECGAASGHQLSPPE